MSCCDLRILIRPTKDLLCISPPRENRQQLRRPGLTHAHETCILMHMRSTLNIDDEMLRKAAALTGEKEKTALVRMGLEALIARESARRLARLGGTEPELSPGR